MQLPALRNGTTGQTHARGSPVGARDVDVGIAEQVVLGEVVRRADLRIAPGYRMRTVQRGITHAPSAGMPVVLDARR
jgi:hypothetical protein